MELPVKREEIEKNQILILQDIRRDCLLQRKAVSDLYTKMR